VLLYLQPRIAMGRYSSGQRGRTVNPLITSSQVRILLSPQKNIKKRKNAQDYLSVFLLNLYANKVYLITFKFNFMKSNLKFSFLLLLTILFVSCKKEEETVSESPSNSPKEIIMPRVQAIPEQNYTQQPTTQNVAPIQNQQSITPNPVVTKPGMNPPHGQPNHRCDIAVGAPLNSPASKTKPSTNSIQPTFTTTKTQTTSTPAILSPNAATTVTEPGMNPPHGQTGHDCAVAVGAPLPKK
jgi:hypothetical protein